jgi:GNAT superfamily N-acetyltransferase
MVHIQQVSWVEIQQRTDLQEEYRQECGFPWLTYNPQWDLYRSMAEAGFMLSLGVFAESEMVGFANIIMAVLPHCGELAATVESLMVSKPYRDKGAGTRLMEAIEASARKAECSLLFYSAPAGSQLEALLELKLDRTSSYFCKPLR